MRKKLLSLFTTCIGLTAAVVLADQVVMPLMTAHGDEIVLPDLSGLPVNEASKKLTTLGLDTKTRDRFSRGKEPGLVLQQIPEPGTRVKSGRVVDLIISTDKVMVGVPSVLLTTLRDARFTLQSQGLEVGRLDTVESHEYPEGIVVAQSMEPGAKVKVGETIDLSISRGHDILEAKVPYAIDKSLADAKSLIADAGLRLGILTKRYSESLLPGTVLEQSIDSGKVVPPLTPLDLVVSSADQSDE